jgi:hypothetical protein
MDVLASIMYLADFPKQLPSEFFVVALAPTHIPAARDDLPQFATRFARRLRGIEVAQVQPKGRL